MKRLSRLALLSGGLMLALFVSAGCKPRENHPPEAALPAPGTAGRVSSTNIPPAGTNGTAEVRTPVRINAGRTTPFVDAQGQRWLADQFFSGGEIFERPELVVTNTAEPELYRSEHYSMESFSCPLPNGNYQVKLHFCEAFEGVTGPGQRVFSFNVQGQEFLDYDVWVKAGGSLTAVIETVPVEIKDGRLLIKFTPKIENPQINGIEILPQTRP